MRRTAGTGSVYRPTYRAKDGKLRESRLWWIKYQVGARAIREPAKTKSKERAEEILRARLTGGVDGRTTFEDLASMIVADYQANGRRSVARVEQCLEHLREAFGTRPAKAITADRITAYTAGRLEDGARPATVNRELAALKRAFRLAERAERVARVPHIQLLEERNTRQGFFERDQYEAVRRHLDEPLQLVVLVAYHTGWRVPSEILTRQWRHLDLKAGWLRLEPGETKSGEGRQFPLTPVLKKALGAQRRLTRALEKRRDLIIPWVFHRDGQRIQRFDKAWVRACREAGCPGRLLHDFRRTAVRNLERAGVSRSAAMALVGHRTESVYRRYAIVDEGTLREAAEKLARLK